MAQNTDLITYNQKIFRLEWDSLVFLIAEDIEENFFLLSEGLKKTKVRLIRASNGQEAVDIVSSGQRVDLVITDIQMPVMDGFMATRLIRAIRQDLPIIAYTAFSYEGVHEKMAISGAQECLIKPFENRTFLNAIRKYLFRT
ncbi:MAG: response regulator [Bacteroidota bacterium]